MKAILEVKQKIEAELIGRGFRRLQILLKTYPNSSHNHIYIRFSIRGSTYYVEVSEHDLDNVWLRADKNITEEDFLKFLERQPSAVSN